MDMLSLKLIVENGQELAGLELVDVWRDSVA